MISSRDERLLADAVAHHAQQGDDAQAGDFPLGQGAHEPRHRRGAALVAGHARHAAVRLQIHAAAVVGDALAREEHGARDGAFGTSSSETTQGLWCSTLMEARATAASSG